VVLGQLQAAVFDERAPAVVWPCFQRVSASRAILGKSPLPLIFSVGSWLWTCRQNPHLRVGTDHDGPAPEGVAIRFERA